jgi:HD-GYP domain-containing protein (c-di-GMP phosphodiesterase class II)
VIINYFEIYNSLKESCQNFKGIRISIKGKVRTYGDESSIFLNLKNEVYNVNFYFEKPIDEFTKILVNSYFSILKESSEENEYNKDFKMLTVIEKLNTKLRLKPFLKEIERGLKDLLECDAVSVLIYDEKTDMLRFLATSGGRSGLIESIPVPMKSIAGTVFKENKTMLFNDLLKDPRHFKGTDKKLKYITKNIVASPIYSENKEIGVIEALNKNDGRAFTEEDTKILGAFAKAIGFKMENILSYEKMSNSFKSIILAMATAIDKRDNYTHLHSENVKFYSLIIGKNYGLNERDLELLEISALLHDFGKVGIPDNILLKQGRLTKEEFEAIRSHPIIGGKLLKNIEMIPQEVIDGVVCHHEKYNGKGYPKGLKDGEIPLFGRIIAVADVYDALTTARPYKDPWPKSKVIKILIEEKNQSFDAKIVDIFLSSIDMEEAV